MKIYAIFPDTLGNSMAIHDTPVETLTNLGIICEKQEKFFSSTINNINNDDIVILWVGSRDENRLQQYSKLRCRKVLRNIDSCKTDRILFKRELEIYYHLGFESMLVTYCTDYNMNFLKEKGINVIKYPHLLDFKKYEKVDIDKKFDVFISGHLSPTSYPLRNKLANFFFNRKDKYKINFLPHPGYRLTDVIHKVYGKDYIDMASSSTLSIICTGDDDSLVAKYLEFAAARTLPLGDAPSNMPKNALNSMILVSKDMKDEELELIVDSALSNQKILSQRTITYQNSIKENFDISKTANIIEKMINNQYDNI